MAITPPWEQILNIAKNTPSGGNMQLWTASVDKNQIMIKSAYESRQLTHAPDKLASFLSVGALAYNIECVASGLGYQGNFDLNNELEPGVCITITSYDESKRDQNIIDLVTNRCTNRKLCDKPINKSILIELENDFEAFVQAEDLKEFQLAITRDMPQMKKIAAVLSKAEVIRFSQLQTREKLFEELKCEESESPFKIHIETLELPWLLEKMMCLSVKHPLMRHCFSPRIMGSVIKSQLLQSSDLGCFSSTLPPSLKELIKFGRVLEYFWLQLTKRGISMQPWASLPFYGMETIIPCTPTFKIKEQKQIQELVQELIELFHQKNQYPLFPFRLHNASPPKNCSTKANIVIEAPHPLIGK